jgi:SAM-dependent methyltransferase
VKACANCGSTRCDPAWRCADCGFQPIELNGYLAFAPDLAHSSDAFAAEFFGDLADIEPDNFWFVSRNRLVRWVVNRYFAGSERVHELGCGTGFVMADLKQVLPQAELSGSELLVDGLAYAASRVPSATFLECDARRLPFRDEFDLVGAFDVLEHIEEDRLVLSQIHAALRAQGGLLVTVPQHPALWSHQDDVARHQRRYRASELDSKVKDAGFEILLSTSFVSLLLPAMFVSRQIGDFRQHKGAREALQPPPGINEIFSTVMALERRMIEAGLRFGVGGSRLIAARRVGGAP